MRRTRLITPVIILLGTFLGTYARAEEPSEKAALTLEEAVALAVERNQQVLIARAQADILKGRYREVRAQALPMINLNGTALRWRDPSFLNASGFDKLPPEFRDALEVIQVVTSEWRSWSARAESLKGVAASREASAPRNVTYRSTS